MKYLLILLFSMNAYSMFKVEMSVNESVDYGQEFKEKDLDKAMNRLIKTAKKKKGWRKGEFTPVEEGSLYSQEFTECLDDLSENCTTETRFYHPSNWKYRVTDITTEVEDQEQREAARAARLLELRGLLADDKAKLKDIQEWIRLKEGIEPASGGGLLDFFTN